jgi:hypothetical protein
MSIRPRLLGAMAFFPLFLLGCGQGVREDRTAAWSPNGQGVAFQHGRDGVYIGNEDGQPPRQVLNLPSDAIAASTPLWDATGKRLLLTTARLAPGEPPLRLAGSNLTPAGQVYGRRRVITTFWLRDETNAAANARTVALFDAACDHPGYVAANLAARWHPDGQHILFVDRAADGGVGLFTFDLKTQQRTSLFPHTAGAMVFDWDPTGTFLGVVMGHEPPDPGSDGLWVARGDGPWWHVAGTEALADAERPALLERLRASGPAWSPEGTRFAVVTCPVPPTQDGPGQHRLLLAQADPRTVAEIARGLEPFRDLHWSPDGRTIGYVRGRPSGTLVVHDLGMREGKEMAGHDVRRFAGWNRTGDQLAYVAADPARPSGSPWTTLLLPDADARDAVFVARRDGANAHVAFSGLRVTFPRWAPNDDRLSLWLTFTPTYRSALAYLVGLGLPAGDPAAILDARTGAVRWQTTSAFEKAQVGHHHLAQHDNEAAWKWYSEAERELPPQAPLAGPVSDRRFPSDQDFTFFQYICLTRLGRRDEAATKLATFRSYFALPAPAADPRPLDKKREQTLAASFGPDLAGLQALIAAEAFLSLDAAAEGQAFFEEQMKTVREPDARLFYAAVLSQFLLIREDYRGYARLVDRTILPLLADHKTLLDRAQTDRSWLTSVEAFPVLYGLAAVLPMASPDFRRRLPDDARPLAEAASRLIPPAPWSPANPPDDPAKAFREAVQAWAQLLEALREE